MSSTNNTDLEYVFIPRGRSLIYIINNEGTKIDNTKRKGKAEKGGDERDNKIENS
jgi:hypothetical protein